MKLVRPIWILVAVAAVAALALPAPSSAAAADCPCTLFSAVAEPAEKNIAVQDGRPEPGPWSYELGVKVTVDEPMKVSALRFYKDALETGVHTGRIWTADGLRLAEVEFLSESASGWQQQALPTRLVLRPGVVYVVSVNVNASFGMTRFGLQTQVGSGPLRSVADGQNGILAQAAGLFPSQSVSSSNYFVDLEVVAPDPPTVTAKAPADASTQVGTETTVTATFSRSMDAASITSQSFTLTPTGGTPVAAAVAYDAATAKATLTPSAPLAAGTTYTARLAETVADADQVALGSAVSWSFTTSPTPTVTAKTPADGATGVTTSTKVTATFSRAMDPATLKASTFTLTPAGGKAVAAQVAYNATTQKATLTSSIPLSGSTVYTAELAATIKAADGTPLGAAVRWAFTTGVAPPLAVTSTSPAGGAAAVAITTKVRAVFSRAISAGTLTNASFTLVRADGTAVPASVAYDSATATATLTPSAPLAFSAGYTARLDTTITAEDGEALGSPVAWTFATVDALRINTGGGSYTSATGPIYVADTFVSGGRTNATTSAISGTDDPKLYQNERWGSFSYAIPVPNGTYEVRLHFAEIYYGTVVSGSCVGKRLHGFDVVDTAASPDLENLDVCAQVGARAALVKTIAGVAVTDGVLNLRSIYGEADDPQLSALEVVPAAPVAPAVEATTPRDGDAEASTFTEVRVTFSKAMDASTITGTSFALTGADGAAVPATIAYDAVTNTATLRPTAPLAYSTRYAARLETTIKAADGTALAAPVSWAFTTVDATRINSGDEEAYTVGADFSADAFFSGGQVHSSTADVAGTFDPALYRNERWGTFSYSIPVPNGVYDVRLHFAEVYYGTVISGSCLGKRVFGMDVVDTPATLDVKDLDVCAEVGPRTALVRTITTVVVGDGALDVKSIDGPVDDPQLAAIEVIPSTAPAPTGPTVTKTAPADGAGGVQPGVKLTATFSQSLDPATVTSSSFTLTPAGGSPVDATVSYDDATKTATLLPAMPLRYSTGYTARLETAITAADGTPLASPFAWTFTTAGATRINAGGLAYLSSGGASFLSDTLFSGGTAFSSQKAISGTSDPKLYQDERFGDFTYAIPVANGTYEVRLHFVELYYGTVVAGDCVGKRIFSIDLLDTATVNDVSDLDVCAEVGPNAALVKTISGVTVTDGLLEVKSVRGAVDDPELAALEVVGG